MTDDEYERHIMWLEAASNHDITVDAKTGVPLYAYRRWYTFDDGRVQVHESFGTYPMLPFEVKP